MPRSIFSGVSLTRMRKRLRVVHLGKFYPPAPGGIETHLQTLARSQAEAGLEVDVVVVNHADRLGNDTTFDRWTRTSDIVDDDGKVRVSRIGRLASVARLDICPTLLKELRRIQHQGVDLFHLHTPNPTMLLALIALGTRVPVVVMHHSDVIRQKLLRHFLTPFERRIYSQAASVIASTPPYIEASPLLKRYRDKVEIIPFGIDLNDYLDPSPAALRASEQWRRDYGEPLWLMVGRLIYYKGIDVALRSLREVPGKLVVVGTGPLREELGRQAESLGVADRVVWKGHVGRDELIGAYRAATAFWFPSNARSEAFGLVQVEAMASGCPIVNTEIHGSGVPWVSPNEVSGLTVPVNDPIAFARAANRLLTEPGLRERYSENARQRCVQEFSVSKMTERTIQLYEHILRRPPSR